MENNIGWEVTVDDIFVVLYENKNLISKEFMEQNNLSSNTEEIAIFIRNQLTNEELISIGDYALQAFKAEEQESYANSKIYQILIEKKILINKV